MERSTQEQSPSKYVFVCMCVFGFSKNFECCSEQSKSASATYSHILTELVERHHQHRSVNQFIIPIARSSLHCGLTDLMTHSTVIAGIGTHIHMHTFNRTHYDLIYSNHPRRYKWGTNGIFSTLTKWANVLKWWHIKIESILDWYRFESLPLIGEHCQDWPDRSLLMLLIMFDDAQTCNTHRHIKTQQDLTGPLKSSKGQFGDYGMSNRHMATVRQTDAFVLVSVTLWGEHSQVPSTQHQTGSRHK